MRLVDRAIGLSQHLSKRTGDINKQALTIVNAVARTQHESAAPQTIMAQAFGHDGQVYGFERFVLERDERANVLCPKNSLNFEWNLPIARQVTSLAQIQELVTQKVKAVTNARGTAPQAKRARSTAVEYKTNVMGIHTDLTAALPDRKRLIYLRVFELLRLLLHDEENICNSEVAAHLQAK